MKFIVFAELVPAALALLPPQIRARLSVVQQCRPEDLQQVRARHEADGIQAECAAFFDDLPAHLESAHLVISRAGASTVAELAAAGRPAILVPFPFATDDHQSANARALEAAGGAILLAESEATAGRLAECLNGFFVSSEALTQAARAALDIGRPAAGQALADLVESLIPANGNPHRTIARKAA